MNARRTLMASTSLLLLALLGRTPVVTADPVAGQVDDFEDGTTMGWREGSGGIDGNPNPPTNVPDGGPLGAGDAFLQNVSTGGFGAGSRQNIFMQEPRWTGNYAAAGLTGIRLQMANLGNEPVSMRMAISNLTGQGGFTNAYSSLNAFDLPADGVWRTTLFEFSDLTSVSAPFSTLEEVLGEVAELRIMHAPNLPTWNSTVASVSTVGFDNIEAVGPVLLTGDANNDGLVSGQDLIAVQQNFGKAEPGPPTGMLPGDANDDGLVTGLDLITVQENFGNALPAAGTPVPEPSALGLLAAGGLGWIRWPIRPS